MGVALEGIVNQLGYAARVLDHAGLLQVAERLRDAQWLLVRSEKGKLETRKQKETVEVVDKLVIRLAEALGTGQRRSSLPAGTAVVRRSLREPQQAESLLTPDTKCAPAEAFQAEWESTGNGGTPMETDPPAREKEFEQEASEKKERECVKGSENRVERMMKKCSAKAGWLDIEMVQLSVQLGDMKLKDGKSIFLRRLSHIERGIGIHEDLALEKQHIAEALAAIQKALKIR